ncbi:MAG: hypothetical protein K6L75_01160 [Cellvibrionaceae bacterium]
MQEKKIVAGISIVAIGLGLLIGVFILNQSEKASVASSQPPETQSPKGSLLESENFNEISESTDIFPALQQTQQRVKKAQLALTNAELELTYLETELAEAEQYIEGLERLGENPAEYAEEGMLLLRPIIEKYEEKLAIAEAAEDELTEATELLDSY